MPLLQSPGYVTFKMRYLWDIYFIRLYIYCITFYNDSYYKHLSSPALTIYIVKRFHLHSVSKRWLHTCTQFKHLHIQIRLTQLTSFLHTCKWWMLENIKFTQKNIPQQWNIYMNNMLCGSLNVFTHEISAWRSVYLYVWTNSHCLPSQLLGG